MKNRKTERKHRSRKFPKKLQTYLDCLREKDTVHSHFDGERVTVIRPRRGWAALDLRELWEYRELLYFLVWRDVKVRYKQTALGAAWAIMQPLLTIASSRSSSAHGATSRRTACRTRSSTFAALLPWTLLRERARASANSLVDNQALITKVYFPRLLIPLAPVLAGLVDFAVAFVVLLALMRLVRHRAALALVLLPFFILLAVVTSLAVALWLSALNVQYRDVRYAVPFLSQFWLFATPVAYPALICPAERSARWIGAEPDGRASIEGFRWALLGTQAAARRA